ncbi:MAG: DUF3164 family protein [Rikenellaceae bacterium]|nr:DUF3164 family protein [Rikenellaceae bacterium]
MSTNVLDNLTSDQLAEMLEQKKREEREKANKKRETYESLKSELISRIESKVRHADEVIRELHAFVTNETKAFYDVMREYGSLRSNEQRSFTLTGDSFRVEVKSNNVKCFDERADIAAARLIEFLKVWIQSSEQGSKDPMYQLAMTLLERNKNGDLDYKSISKLYALESQFDSPVYSEIMQLFKESNTIEGTSLNFYFYEKTESGAWTRMEVSFNRL